MARSIKFGPKKAWVAYRNRAGDPLAVQGFGDKIEVDEVETVTLTAESQAAGFIAGKDLAVLLAGDISTAEQAIAAALELGF